MAMHFSISLFNLKIKKLVCWLGLITVSHTPAFAHYQLQQLPLAKIGKVAQFTLDEHQQLLAINQQGELWQVHNQHCIINGLSTHISPVANYGKIAVADRQQQFLLLEKNTAYRSNIRLSPWAGMVMLPFATIAVQDEHGIARLVRIEKSTDRKQADLNITARFATPVLADSQPIQINFQGDNQQGHIAVLARPDSQTYQHGVLGDAIEAGELHYLERHTLRPLATPLSVKGAVFEANRMEILPTSQGNRLISVLAGNGEGAKTIVVGERNQQLEIQASSPALPSNRWQSPFVFNAQLFAVQMPHLIGRLVQFQQLGMQLNAQTLEEGLSNHAIGEYETNLTASTQHFAVIPNKGYQSVRILDQQGNLHAIQTSLPARIHKMLASPDTAYLLLQNGEIWQIRKNER